MSNTEHFEAFRTNLISCNLAEVEKAWKTMSDADKTKMKIEIASLPKDMRRDIHLRLNMLNENLALEIMGNIPIPSKVYLDGRWFSPKEIRDTCLVNVKSVPRFIMAIFALKETEKRSLLAELQKVDVLFYDSVMTSLSRLERHTKEAVQHSQSLEASLQDAREAYSTKTPITYLAEYLENKAEVLAVYRKKLVENGLTQEQATRIVEIESQLLGPEAFNNGT